MNQKTVIAILGLPGSGKTEAIKYLMKKYDWPKVYFGDVTFNELKRRGLEVNEKNERMVREELREKFGKDYYAKKVVEKVDALGEQNFVLVESLYMWTEYKVLKESYDDHLMTVVIHAAPRERYARLKNRPQRPLSEEEARSRDYAQIEKLEQGGPIAMADYMVNNTGSMEDLRDQLEIVMEKIRSRMRVM